MITGGMAAVGPPAISLHPAIRGRAVSISTSCRHGSTPDPPSPI